MAVIMIDPGHGGPDPGAVGNGLKEKDLTLLISLDLYELLSDFSEHDVYITRSEDEGVSLQKRTVLANDKNSDIFVSIHVNGFHREGANGIETLHYPGSENGIRLAEKIQQAMLDQTFGFSDRGLRARSDVLVLRATSMPAVMPECGFITNPEDAFFLGHELSRPLFAVAVFRGITRYFGS